MDHGMPGPQGPAALARLVAETDWAATPLGPQLHWPLALRLAVDLILASRFPMLVMWGEERAMVYNAGYAAILGARHPAALGRPVDEVWPELRGQLGPLISRTYAGEALWFEDLEMEVARNGHPERAWFTFSYSPLRDALGVVRGLLNTVVETTDRVLAQRALAEREAELERRVQERTAELMRAEQALRHSEKLQAMGQLTGSLAHDFGNVLQVVDSGMHLLSAEGLTPEERQQVTEGVGASLDNARRMIRQLLAFARQQPLEPVAFDLSARIGGMTELLRHSLGRGIRLETALAEGLPAVTLDPAQLETAILNLVMNARDAMPQGGRLRLATGLAGGRPCLTVADDGEGMPPEVMARLFEPFFTTKPAGKGTGLGLAQVHGFVTQSGGDVRVDSAPGQGTSFTLVF
ncbi:sensor histidine kinase [Roseococcus sp. DSY-14]|uniref:sensor histidine kinase n=1 Tax=Roseococcus sp. DSY-14 TaxID=3369650 RepID=UPI00387B6871